MQFKELRTNKAILGFMHKVYKTNITNKDKYDFVNFRIN